MAWTEEERTRIRHALGFGAIFLQAYPLLENAMTAVQSVDEGGSRPDRSTEDQIRGWLDDIDRIEDRMRGLESKHLANVVDGDTKIDSARALAVLRQEGRRYVNYISTALATYPRRDIFSSAPPNPSGPPFDISSWG